PASTVPPPRGSRDPQVAQHRQTELPFDLPLLDDATAEPVLADDRRKTEYQAAEQAGDEDHLQIWPDRDLRHLCGPDHRIAVLESGLGDRELDPGAIGPLQNTLELIQFESQAHAC